MKFYGCQRQAVDFVRLSDKLLVALSWQAEDKVRPAVDTSLGGHLNSANSRSVVVPTIYCCQNRIVRTLNTILKGDIVVHSKSGEVVQLLFVHAVGASADDNTHHKRV